MKQARWIWILGIAAVVLIGIFILVDMNSDKKERQKHIGDAKQLLQFDENKATGVYLKNEDGVFRFEWDPVNLGWAQTEGEEIRVNHYAVSAIVSYACHLESLKTVAFDSSSKDVYGFTDPIEIRITTTDTDDAHPYIIYVGDNTPTYDAYYAMIGGSDEIYTIDYNSGSVFCASKNALKNAYLFDTTAAQVSLIRIEKTGSPVLEISRDAERAWQIIQPAGFTPAKAYVDELADRIVHIGVESFVEDNPSDLAQYGLDKPHTKLLLKGTDGENPLEEEIWFGNPISDSENETELYGYFVGSKQVFRIKKADISFTDTTIVNVIMPYCADIDLSTLSSIDIDMGEVTDVKARLELDTDTEQYRFNDTDISGLYDDNITKLFSTFCRSVTNLAFSDVELDAKPDADAEPAITIVYTFKDKTQKKLTFINKTENSYYLFTDGKYSGMTIRLNRFTSPSCVKPCYDALVQGLKDKNK